MPLLHLVAPGRPPSNPAEHALLPHILLVVDSLPKTLGGGERIVLRLAELLPRYGFRASILTFAIHPETSFQAVDAPCPVYLLPLTKTYDLTAMRGALALRRFLERENVRIVQTFFESSDLWAGIVTRALTDAKLIWSRRDMGILRGRKHVIAYRALRHMPHAVFAVSNQVAQHVREVDAVPADRVHVIYNGLDLDLVAPAPGKTRNEAPVITTVGNIRRVKGHDLLVRAAPAVLARFPAAIFTIAGDVLEPAYFEELTRSVRELGLEGRFVFLGKISDLSVHLAGADLFVLPSRSEGFSNALIEAMAAGVPAVATDVGGNAEAITDGVSGLIVPPEDATALAVAMLRLLEDPVLSHRLAATGMRVAKDLFSAEAMMRRTIDIYTQLLDGNP